MHSGTKYNERGNPQPASIVVRLGSLDEFVAPTDFVYYYSGYGNQYIYDPSEWRHEPLIPNKSEEKAVAEEQAKTMLGKKINLLLSLEINGVTNDYLFEFQINSYKLTSKNFMPYIK